MVWYQVPYRYHTIITIRGFTYTYYILKRV